MSAHRHTSVVCLSRLSPLGGREPREEGTRWRSALQLQPPHGADTEAPARQQIPAKRCTWQLGCGAGNKRSPCPHIVRGLKGPAGGPPQRAEVAQPAYNHPDPGGEGGRGTALCWGATARGFSSPAHGRACSSLRPGEAQVRLIQLFLPPGRAPASPPSRYLLSRGGACGST